MEGEYSLTIHDKNIDTGKDWEDSKRLVSHFYNLWTHEKQRNDTIYDFLYGNAPFGFPSNFKVYCSFEVGGAYEDWGWIVERDGETYACDRSLSECLKKARAKASKELGK